MHELLERHYDDDGKLFFVAKVDRGKVKAGDVLYGYPVVMDKGKACEHVRYQLCIDDYTRTMSVWNYIYHYGDYDRNVYTVDHADRNPLNDHHTNLRLLTRSDQNKNRSAFKRKNSTSNYHGVSFHRQSNKWRAKYCDKTTGNLQHIGLYPDEKAAAQAYDLATWQDRGEIDRLNFPEFLPIYESLTNYQSKFPDVEISIE